MIKASLGNLEINFDPVAVTEEMGFQPLNSAEDAVQLTTLPFHHRDPFDRMLHDRRFAAYDCALI